MMNLIENTSQKQLVEHIQSKLEVVPLEIVMTENRNVISCSVTIKRDGKFFMNCYFMAKWEGIIRDWGWFALPGTAWDVGEG
jgi:hypothetical protein